MTEDAEFRRWLVNMAKVDNVAIVFAVWPDQRAPDGIGAMVIKGADLLHETVDPGTAVIVSQSVMAFRCASVEVAEALRPLVGTEQTH